MDPKAFLLVLSFFTSTSKQACREGEQEAHPGGWISLQQNTLGSILDS